jgi:hypothetical protein
VGAFLNGCAPFTDRKRFLYRAKYSIDANFKLKLKDRAALSTLLADGWAYFVEDGPYLEHLANYTDAPDVKLMLLLYYFYLTVNLPADEVLQFRAQRFTCRKSNKIEEVRCEWCRGGYLCPTSLLSALWSC